MKKIKNITGIFYYFQGHIRLFMYNNKYLKRFVPLHIREQYEIRLYAMKDECLSYGHCTACGCSTPALQMCKKSCDENCYPEMMSKKEWLWSDRLKK